MIFIRRSLVSRPVTPRPVLFAGLLVAVLGLALAAGCGNPTGTSSSTAAVAQPGGSGSTSSTSGPGTSATTPGGASTSSSTSTSSSLPSGPEPGAGDWPTYHHDAGRSGLSSDQGGLGDVRQVWTSAEFDAPLYAQPLVVGDRVFAASEGNTVYALDTANGVVAWQANLGEAVPAGELPCGNIDPSGITGTPVIDTQSRTLYVVANLRSGPHHELFALDLSSGAVEWHRAIDPPGLEPAVEQQRGALALNAGRIYVPFGGLYGDCGPYKGAVVSVAADGSGDIASYIVPTSRMAGIWNPAGPAVDGEGDLWVTTGNSAGQSTFDYGNALIRLGPELKVIDYFAPADWARLNAGDVDLGSLGPVLLAGGRALAVGKAGVAYLVDAANLGEVGKPLASLNVGSSAFGAAATAGSTTAFIPCARALVALETKGDKLAVVWRLGGGSGPRSWRPARCGLSATTGSSRRSIRRQARSASARNSLDRSPASSLRPRRRARYSWPMGTR